MSAEGYLFGCIMGIGLRGEGLEELYRLNRAAIEALPDKVEWPAALLTRATFAVPMRDDAAPFYRHQMLHFGASVNHLEVYWADWRQQFESLLRKLFWEQAYVQMSAELHGTFEYRWEADDAPMRLTPPQPVRAWKFTGGPRAF